MTKFKSSTVIQSTVNAIHGLKLAFYSQRNFVIEIVISICVVSVGIYLKFSITDLCILIIMALIVLVCELINSVIEFMIDAVYKNNYSKLAEMAKDISAGMVFLSCTISFIIGTLLFWNYINKLLVF